jgi:uncharacterized protein YjiK
LDLQKLSSYNKGKKGLAKERDELRLYMNNQIDPNRLYFKPDNIIVFQKFQTEDLTNLY